MAVFFVSARTYSLCVCPFLASGWHSKNKPTAKCDCVLFIEVLAKSKIDWKRLCVSALGHVNEESCYLFWCCKRYIYNYYAKLLLTVLYHIWFTIYVTLGDYFTILYSIGCSERNWSTETVSRHIFNIDFPEILILSENFNVKL